MSQKGQIILLLILVMTVALAIGLSVVQKSLVDISTASKVEQSSRAFSAAEAGIEKALKSNTNATCANCQNFTESSSQIANIDDRVQIPPTPALNTQQVGLEYPPLAKEDVAHFWLADPTTTTEFYMPASKAAGRGIEIYWGNPNAEKAAIAVKVIYYDGSKYTTAAYHFDSDGSRTPNNGFTDASGNCTTHNINTTSGTNRSFYCKGIIGSFTSPSFPSSGLMLLRAKLLYNSTSQPIAVRGYGTCGKDCSLPPQAREIISTGVSGETQRRVKLFLLDKVVPPYFDYAIFSAGEISK